LVKKIFFCFIISFVSQTVFAATSPVQDNFEYDWHWFFYESSLKGNTSFVAYRPFYMEIEKEDKIFEASLMPLFYWRYKSSNLDVRRGLLGFCESDNYVHRDNHRDNDFGLFPLFFYGSGSEEDDGYLFLYPFGGTIKGKMGLDYMSPYIFPGLALFFLYPPASIFSMKTLLMGVAALVPLYMNYGRGDYRAHSILWPLVMWGKGPGRKDIRIWPFYSRSYKKGWYDNYSYLFFYNYQHYFFRNDEKFTSFLFPAYGRKWSKSGESSAVTLLYPFFSWGRDRKKGGREINMPWPIVQIADSESPRMRKRIFFPFYGSYEYNNYRSTFVTPLYFNITRETKSFTSSYTYNFILCWYFKRDYKIRHEYYGNSWRYFKIWPLLNIEWSDSGLYSINILSLLPFRDTMGYEKLYGTFWTLFEYRKNPEGTKYLGFLFRTYYQVWSDDYFKFKIPAIVSYEKKGGAVRELTFILEGFGYDSDRKGSYVKLFWIPIRIGKGYVDGKEDIADNGNDETFDEPIYSLKYASNLREEGSFDNSMYYTWRAF